MNLGKETEILEFKKSTSEVKDAVIDICAILNKHEGGTLFFGVKPNGEVIGQQIGFSTLDDVAKTIKEAIKPMIFPNIEEINLEGCTCIKVEFNGKERPYSCYGRYYKRVVDRSEIMTPNELKSTMASTDVDCLWENHVTKYDISYLDKESLNSYYNNAVLCGRIARMENYDEQSLLERLGLMENGYFTNAGLYLFSNKKPVVLKIATYVTDERINFSDIRRVEDNIYNLIKYSYNYIIEKMNWRVELGDNTSRVEIPEVPVEALREIIVNSFAHADYRGITENEIDITPTQIEIYNPGEFPLNMTPEMFVDRNFKSHPRNKVILNTLYKSKDVEMFGSGFKKVFKLCKLNNVDFKYESNMDGFSFVFYRVRPSNNVTLNDTKNVTLTTGTNDEILLNNTDKKVLNLLKENHNYTRDEISEKISLSVRTIQRSIDKLSNSGLIIRIGSKKVGYWEVIK